MGDLEMEMSDLGVEGWVIWRWRWVILGWKDG